MSAPHIILDNLPSLCQKLSDLVEVWPSYNKNNFACFLRHGVQSERRVTGECPGSWKEWCVRRRRLYRCDAVDRGGRNACNMWFENIEVLVKSSSSAVEYRLSKVGKSDGTADVQNPDLFARRRTASTRWRSVAGLQSPLCLLGGDAVNDKWI